jgi:hypothetical protein
MAAAAEIIATFLRAASHNLRYTGIDVLARMVLPQSSLVLCAVLPTAVAA